MSTWIRTSVQYRLLDEDGTDLCYLEDENEFNHVTARGHMTCKIETFQEFASIPEEQKHAG